VEGTSPFVRAAAFNLANAARADDFAAWARAQIDERRTRHEAVHAVWRSVADAAPSMGMIGTILGLIGMFAAMDDPATIGPAMALALLTTFYGLVLSALVAIPIAGRLERLSAAELRWQQVVLTKLEAIARAEEAGLPPNWGKRIGARG
jgi:chemotaxis protein MotA